LTFIELEINFKSSLVGGFVSSRSKQLNVQAARVFLSYAREDKQKVKAIYRELSVQGFTPWLDMADLEPGQDWQQVIGKAIRNARFVLMFLSKKSVAKRGYFQREISEALRTAETIPEGQKFIIPVRLEECFVPEKLSNWHWCDVFKPYGLRKLIETLGTSLGGSPSPNRRPRRRRGRLTEDALFDLLLAEKYWERKQCRIGKLPDGRVAISNGAMLEFRTEVPRVFKDLYQSVRQALELAPSQVNHVTPKPSEYRQSGNVVTSIKKGAASYYLLLESRGGARCAVDIDYVTYILQKYPRATIYLAGKEPKVMVEEDEAVRFLLMPMSVGNKGLEPI
jgi:hypothetical protein